MPFIGSGAMQNSGAGNHEVVPAAPADWSNNRYHLKSLSFLNSQACTIRVNDSDEIYLEANQGLAVEADKFNMINSFIVVDAGVDYQWIGLY